MNVDTNQTQDDGWSCGPNSIARLLRSYGQNVSYDTVRNFTESDGNLVSLANLGTPSSQMIDSLRRWKPDARMEEDSSTSRLIEILRTGKPVIALVSMGSESIFGGNAAILHYVVVNGYDAATDSFNITNTNGDRLTWTRSDFEYKWNWHNDFTGLSGELAQAGVELLGMDERTMFY